MEKISNSIIIGCWLVFVAYWLASALTVKRTAERKSWLSSLAYRLPFIFGALLLLNPRLPHPLNLALAPKTFWMQTIAVVVCILGLLVTIWARWTLAGNWSSTVTFKLGHELIRTGPYRFARHPIYTGILLMCLGSVIKDGQARCWFGLLFIIVGIWVKLKQEEALMLQHFPDDYPAYRKQVKSLVPFVI
jgi:protein-S-isoprenylcysteine O-methyltransferase Ste14